MRANHERGNEDRQSQGNRDNSQRQRVSNKKDFWDNIAEDVAKGYGAQGPAKDIRNRDQEPNDNRRGDEVD